MMRAKQNGLPQEGKNKKVIALIILLLFSLVLVTGCASQSVISPIKSPEDVSKSLDNVSESVGKISGILTDVDKNLGGG